MTKAFATRLSRKERNLTTRRYFRAAEYTAGIFFGARTRRQERARKKIARTNGADLAARKDDASNFHEN